MFPVFHKYSDVNQNDFSKDNKAKIKTAQIML